jgi:hypothetical protein
VTIGPGISNCCWFMSGPLSRHSESAYNKNMPLPDPIIAHGPYRPFTVDPDWDEAWWWFGIPVLFAVWLIVMWRVAPEWSSKWIIPEGYGILEFSQFVTMLVALIIAVRLLIRPFVHKRPFVLIVTIIAALSCLYTAGEEMSWGQHFFHWKTPEYWAMVNRQEETNLHNTYRAFEQWPRAILELGVVIGGILVPLAAAFFPRVRSNRLSLFLPAGALMPTAVIAIGFKLAGVLSQKGYVPELVHRPSEAVELYLYYFIFAYLLIFMRRIAELETQEDAQPAGVRSLHPV